MKIKHPKKIAALAAALIIAPLLMASECGGSQADVAAANLSIAAENFEVPRRITGINGITDKYLFEVVGYCSVETSASALGGAMEATCKVVDPKTNSYGYTKTFLGLSDNVTYVVEQLEPAQVSINQYRVIIRPTTILPAFELDLGEHWMNPDVPALEVIRTKGSVPMELWGKDHRTTLLYAETRAVDHRGQIDRNQMREDGLKYPTYLKDGVQMRGHNDYDCLYDAEAAGLLTIDLDGTIVFTDAGWAYVGGLRRARAERMLARVREGALSPS